MQLLQPKRICVRLKMRHSGVPQFTKSLNTHLPIEAIPLALLVVPNHIGEQQLNLHIAAEISHNISNCAAV